MIFMNGQSDQFLYDFCIYNDIPINKILTLDKYNKEYGNFILNLDLDTKIGSNGTHWVCLIHQINNDNLKDIYFYFDSMGLNPPKELLNKIKSKKCIYSNIQFQNFTQNDKNCGIWCMIFLKFISLFNKINFEEFNYILEYMKDIEIFY